MKSGQALSYSNLIYDSVITVTEKNVVVQYLRNIGIESLQKGNEWLNFSFGHNLTAVSVSVQTV